MQQGTKVSPGWTRKSGSPDHCSDLDTGKFRYGRGFALSGVFGALCVHHPVVAQYAVLLLPCWAAICLLGYVHIYPKP